MSTVRLTVSTKIRHSQVPSIIKNVRSNSDQWTYDFARAGAAGARHRVHVITGRLKRSIQNVKAGPHHHKIIVGEYYGAYEEYGTRHRPPHPFLRPAVEEQKRIFQQRIRGVFRGGEVIHR